MQEDGPWKSPKGGTWTPRTGVGLCQERELPLKWGEGRDSEPGWGQGVEGWWSDEGALVRCGGRAARQLGVKEI